MDKGSQLAIGVSIVIFAIVAALFIPGGFNISSSTTFLSVDNVDLTSNYKYFNGDDIWVLQAKQGGLGQTVEFDATTLKTSDGVESVERVDFKFEYPMQNCVYELVEREKYNIYPVFEKDYVEWLWLGIGEPSISKCQSKVEVEDPYDSFYFKEKDRCVEVDSFAAFKRQASYNTHRFPVATLENTWVDYKIVAKVKIGDGDWITGDITRNQKYLYLPSGKPEEQSGDYVFISLEDFFATNQICPYTGEMPYMGLYYNNGWSLFHKGLYDQYLAEVFSMPKNGISTTAYDTTENWVDDVNDRTKDIIGGLGQSSALAKTDKGADFRKDVSGNPVIKPNFYIVIKGDELKIRTEAAKPDILEVSNKECYYTGGIDEYDTSEGKISLTIKNNGDDGEIMIGGVCSKSNFIIKEKPFTFGEGETRTVEITYYASTDKEEENVECTAKAYSPVKVSSKSVTLCVQGHTICKKDEKSCGHDQEKDLDFVTSCNSEGTGFSLSKWCEASEVCKAGKCVAAGSNGGGEEDEFSFWGLIIASVVGFVVFLSILGGTANLRKADKRLNIAMWVLSALGGVVVLLLSYKLIQWIIQFFTSLKFW